MEFVSDPQISPDNFNKIIYVRNFKDIMTDKESKPLDSNYDGSQNRPLTTGSKRSARWSP
jgi:acylaminoacyl-peptidase